MHPHHSQSIKNVKEHFERDPTVLALLLSGSIAHGFEAEDSDVDILILLSEEEYQKRIEKGQRTFVTTDLITYPKGYVDGKYISLNFIRQVAAKGSEPARFAFDGARILFSRIPDLESEVRSVVAYPVAEKADRIARFCAQLEAWAWYCSEALKRDNRYLLGVAVGKLILFGGRLILAHNEMLYPFHKWFLAVLEKAPDKPEGLLPCIHRLTVEPTKENLEAFYMMVKDFQPWNENLFPNGWGAQFVIDSELNWLDGKTPVDDL